jgi:3',5'-cyclic AMP phosphodiesterase CpdA
MTPEIAQTMTLAEQHEWFQQRRSRRHVLKGTLASAGAMALGPALRVGEAGAVAAPSPSPTVLLSPSRPNGSGVVPFGRRISYGANPTTEMNIGWQVASPVTNPFVRIGTNAFNLSERLPAVVKSVNTPWADITDALDSVPPALSAAQAPEEQYYVHAALNGLAPGTTYYYTVGHQGFDPALGGQLQSFTTAPSRQSAFTFTAFGDQGVSYDAVGTTNLILAQNPAFHLHAGDVSYAENGGSGLLTDAYDPRAWDSFFVETSPTAAVIPWMVSLGNHEMEPWYSPNGYGADVDRLDFPGNGPSVCPGTYSFVYGNVAVISLDPNDVSYEIPANFGYSDGAQTAWLGSTLATLRSDPRVDFIVVFFHHCAYCTCVVHGSEGGVRQFWTPLFDQYSVDLVINGHNHIYERTDPIKAGAPTGPAPIGATITPATQGTTYVACGGAGKSLYSFSAPDSYENNVDNVSSVSSYINEAGGTTQNETVEWSQVRYTGYSLIAVDVVPGGSTATMTVRALSEAGAEIDRFVLSRPS